MRISIFFNNFPEMQKVKSNTFKNINYQNFQTNSKILIYNEKNT